MAYDASRKRVVLFGGTPEARSHMKRLDDTWEWDGSTWHNVTPTVPGPTARAGHALVYDPVRQRVVLFGGEAGSSTGALNDTWTWDGMTWTQVTNTPTPPNRGDIPLAFDGTAGHAILYGGWNGSVLADMWSFSGSVWSQINGPHGPGKRRNHHLAYDESRRRVVLFGGGDGSTMFADTWEWINGMWVQQPTQGAPAARGAGAMVYDSRRQCLVLFGGQDAAQRNLGDTWEYGPTTAVFPGNRTLTEGNTAYAGIFGEHLGQLIKRSRTQCLMEASAVAGPTTGTVRAIEFRRDPGNPPNTFLARSSDLQVTMGIAASDAESMSTTFAANWKGPPSIVFARRTFNAPAQPIHPSPAPFDIHIPFTGPFAWSGQDLVYEVEVFNSQRVGTGPYGGYELDAEHRPRPSADGTVLPYGTSCKGPNGKPPQFLLPTAADVTIDHAFANGLAGASPNIQAINLFGHTDKVWSGVPLPVAFPGTTCYFYTNALVEVGSSTDAAGAAKIRYQIPNDPKLSGMSVYTQWAVLEPARSSPAVTLTSAARLIVGRPPTSPFDSVATLSGAATGVKASTYFAVIVTRLVF